jgi:hypothetical protein
MNNNFSIFLNLQDPKALVIDADKDYLLIKVTLPICLHLDDRSFYIISKKGTKIEIKTENYFYEKETPLGTGINIEVLSDEFSHFRFTRVLVKIPIIENEPIDNSKLLDLYGEIFFESINTFINSARIALNRHGLKNYHDFSGFMEMVDIKRTGLLMHHVECGITPAMPLRSDTLHNRIQGLMLNGISLHATFLSDSMRDYYYHNYTHSIINAVISLEIVLSDFIRKAAIMRGIDESSIDDHIRRVGLTGNLKTTLKLLVPKEISFPNEEVFTYCKSAITLRNAIVHKGRRNVLKKDVEQLINYIKLMIIFIMKLLKHSKLK